MDLGHWQLAEGLEYKTEAFGFIYEITNNALETPKKYIGKKQCVSRIKRKPLKGKTRNRIDQKESDWKTYTGSSVDLNADITKHGKENFTFTIIEWCNSKWELSYAEAKLQFALNVLFDENFYNGILNLRLCKAPKFLRTK